MDDGDEGMSESIQFTVPGVPVGQPRYIKHHKHGKFYVPRTKKGKAHAIVAWRRIVQAIAINHRPGKLIDVPMAVDLVFAFPRPKLHYGTGRNASRLKDSAPIQPCEHKHDLDNLAKAVMDAMTGIIWVDDGLVNRVVITKQYAGAFGPCAVVRVELLENAT